MGWGGKAICAGARKRKGWSGPSSVDVANWAMQRATEPHARHGALRSRRSGPTDEGIRHDRPTMMCSRFGQSVAERNLVAKPSGIGRGVAVRSVVVALERGRPHLESQRAAANMLRRPSRAPLVRRGGGGLVYSNDEFYYLVRTPMRTAAASGPCRVTTAATMVRRVPVATLRHVRARRNDSRGCTFASGKNPRALRPEKPVAVSTFVPIHHRLEAVAHPPSSPATCNAPRGSTVAW